MTKRKKLALGLAMFGSGIVCAIWWAQAPWPTSFLEKYPRYRGKGEGTKFNGPNALIGQADGHDVFTFKGDWDKVVLEAREALVDAGWKQSGSMFRSNFGEEVRIYRGKSVYAPDPHYKYKGRPMFNRFIIDETYGAKIFGVDPASVKGWITIHHSWQAREGILDSVLVKLKLKP